ncbi:MAG: hypothetical protein MK102_10245 [Fuerstiella sp.]|nr:hypothetical protein [Fuerstiella sp.]
MSYMKPATIVLGIYTITALVLADESSEPPENADIVQQEPTEIRRDDLVTDPGVETEAFVDEPEPDEPPQLDRGAPHQRHQDLTRESNQSERRQNRRRLQNRIPRIQEGQGLWFARRLLEQLEGDLQNRRRRQDEHRPEPHRADGNREEHFHHEAEHRQPHRGIHRRIENMERAIMHLYEADLPELAEQVEHRVQIVRHELHEMPDHHYEENALDSLQDVMRQLELLRTQVQQLRNTVDSLRETR